MLQVRNWNGKIKLSRSRVQTPLLDPNPNTTFIFQKVLQYSCNIVLSIIKFMKILITLFVLFFSSSLVADECIKGNCVNGYGIYEFSSGTVYIGQNKDNLASGKGTVIFGDGEWKDDIYSGEWLSDSRHGIGTYIHSDGDIYVGEYLNHEKNGMGIYIYGPGEWEGDIYRGEFKNGVKHGFGTYLFEDGDIYIGEFKNGDFHGQGTYTFNDGEIWDGLFSNGDFIE